MRSIIIVIATLIASGERADESEISQFDIDVIAALQSQPADTAAVDSLPMVAAAVQHMIGRKAVELKDGRYVATDYGNTLVDICEWKAANHLRDAELAIQAAKAAATSHNKDLAQVERDRMTFWNAIGKAHEKIQDAEYEYAAHSWLTWIPRKPIRRR